MTTQIYYFSGTGNSLSVARDLAAQLDARLIAIPRVMDRATLTPEADCVGLVFPVYHKGLPLILQRFVEKLTGLDHKYIFGACTYGDTSGMAIPHLQRLVRSRGGHLAAGFGVHMPFNYLTPAPVLRGFFSAFTLREVALEKQRALVAEAPAKIGGIAAAVKARQSGAYEIICDPLTRLADALNLNESLGKWVWLKVAGVEESTALSFIESRQLMDRAFQADENCNGCGVCAKICPVGNIEMAEQAGAPHARPAWQQRCEQCFACLHWCPQAALQFGDTTAGKQRYHHPDVKLADMLKAAPSTTGEPGMGDGSGAPPTCSHTIRARGEIPVVQFTPVLDAHLGVGTLSFTCVSRKEQI